MPDGDLRPTEADRTAVDAECACQMVDAEGVLLKRRISAGPGVHRRNEGVGLRVSKWDSQIPFLGLTELDVLLQDIPPGGTVMTTVRF